MNRYIEGIWEGYLATVVPGNAGPEQIQATRWAFFAGATALFTIQNDPNFFEGGDEPTAADMAKMDEIHAELSEFGAQLDKAAFGSTVQ